MRYDIQKRLFLTKKLVELKSVRLVQRAYRSKFKNRPCQTAKAIKNYLKNLIQPEQYLICHQNRRKSETFELIPEIS